VDSPDCETADDERVAVVDAGFVEGRDGRGGERDRDTGGHLEQVAAEERGVVAGAAGDETIRRGGFFPTIWRKLSTRRSSPVKVRCSASGCCRISSSMRDMDSKITVCAAHVPSR